MKTSEMTPERKKKLSRVATLRQHDLTVVLENVHDPHNIAAVMRTCDSVGIKEIYVLNTELHLQKSPPVMGKRSSAGTMKWIDIRVYHDVESCFNRLRQQYRQILGTHLSEDSTSLYANQYLEATAIVFGNEHDGLSEEALSHCTGNINIPQVGMVASLNISVACAVSLYEVFRQRQQAGYYTPPYRMPRKLIDQTVDEYLNK